MPEPQINYLAGVLVNSNVHWAVGPDPEKPGWTPYAALGQRFTDKKIACQSARNAKVAFGLPAGLSVVVPESEAFKPVSGMEYEKVEEPAETK